MACVLLVSTSVLCNPCTQPHHLPHAQFAFKKGSLIFLGLFAIQTKRTSRPVSPRTHAHPSSHPAVYANSFLGSLNARAHIRNASQNTGGRMFSSNSRGPEFTISAPRVRRLATTLSLALSLSCFSFASCSL